MKLYTIDEIAQKAGVAYSTVSYIFRQLGGVKAVKREANGTGKGRSSRKSYYNEDAFNKVLEFREKQKAKPPKKSVVVNPEKQREFLQKDKEPVRKPLTETFNLLANGETCERCGHPAERIFGMGGKSFTLCEECRKLFVKVLSLERVAFMPPEDEAVAN